MALLLLDSLSGLVWFLPPLFQEWKASIRHKLSNYRVFVRDATTTHAGLWSIDPARNRVPPFMYPKGIIQAQLLDRYMRVSVSVRACVRHEERGRALWARITNNTD